MKHILLVEDDPDISQMYATKFRLEGLDMVIARTAHIALSLIKRRRPDLILLDLLLPEMGGLEMLSIIKKDPHTRDIPVIILTNQSSDDAMKEAIEIGAEAYLIKGEVEPKYVVRMVQGMLLYTPQRS